MAPRVLSEGVSNESANPPPVPQPFTAAQKEYLAGFMAGVSASGVFVGVTPAGQFTATAASGMRN